MWRNINPLNRGKSIIRRGGSPPFALHRAYGYALPSRCRAVQTNGSLWGGERPYAESVSAVVDHRVADLPAWQSKRGPRPGQARSRPGAAGAGSDGISVLRAVLHVHRGAAVAETTLIALHTYLWPAGVRRDIMNGSTHPITPIGAEIGDPTPCRSSGGLGTHVARCGKKGAQARGGRRLRNPSERSHPLKSMKPEEMICVAGTF